jgi:hypothetical protein
MAKTTANTEWVVQSPSFPNSDPYSPRPSSSPSAYLVRLPTLTPPMNASIWHTLNV